MSKSDGHGATNSLTMQYENMLREKLTYPIHITLVVLISAPSEAVCLAIKRWLLL